MYSRHPRPELPILLTRGHPVTPSAYSSSVSLRSSRLMQQTVLSQRLCNSTIHLPPARGIMVCCIELDTASLSCLMTILPRTVRSCLFHLTCSPTLITTGHASLAEHATAVGQVCPSTQCFPHTRNPGFGHTASLPPAATAHERAPSTCVYTCRAATEQHYSEFLGQQNWPNSHCRPRPTVTLLLPIVSSSVLESALGFRPFYVHSVGVGVCSLQSSCP